MALQNQVRFDLASGFPGEAALGSILRAASYVLKSTDPNNNVFGRFFTLDSSANAIAGGTGAIAGIMSDPKSAVLQGTSAGTLAPTLQIPNGVYSSFTTNGIIFVILASAAAIDDLVTYNTTTGILDRVVKGTSTAPAGYAFVPNCRVTHYATTGAGLAVVTINN